MPSDRRRNDRAPIEVKVEYRTVGSFLSDWTVNISRGGMFIATLSPLNSGAEVRLVFSLPGMPIMFDLNGTVKWTQEEEAPDQPAGMGIEFFQITDQIRKRIESYVEKHKDKLPTPRRPVPVEQPIVTMDTESGLRRTEDQLTQPFGRPLPDDGDDRDD